MLQPLLSAHTTTVSPSSMCVRMVSQVQHSDFRTVFILFPFRLGSFRRARVGRRRFRTRSCRWRCRFGRSARTGSRGCHLCRPVFVGNLAAALWADVPHAVLAAAVERDYCRAVRFAWALQFACHCRSPFCREVETRGHCRPRVVVPSPSEMRRKP